MRMMLFFAGLVMLAGCNTPSPRFYDSQTADVTVRDMSFRVFYTPWQAEAVRTNAMWPVRIGDVMVKATQAIEQVSGCAVAPESMRGDPSVIRADLQCPGAPPMPAHLKPRTKLDCTVSGGFAEEDFAEFECDVFTE